VEQNFMLDALTQLTFFTAKGLIVIIMILVLLAGILGLFSRGKNKKNGKISIKNINKHYNEVKENLLQEILPKKAFKKLIKDKKMEDKEKTKLLDKNPQKNIYIIDFNGDIKASAVASLREEITAILNIAQPHDEVVVRLESAGGMVHAYGLATAQLMRIRQRNIPLTICVDKVAASGGYMMAAVANKILSAPYAIIGSIGVIFQLPNFHRALKEKNIDFEQVTAGNYKRTLTIFGENTEEGREKLHQEIEEIHLLFKNLIHDYRQNIDIEKVSTGEHWLAKQAIEYQLVDELITSDDYLLNESKNANLYEISYHIKKSLTERLFSSAQLFKQNILAEPYIHV
jgi:serine protease SohB